MDSLHDITECLILSFLISYVIDRSTERKRRGGFLAGMALFCRRGLARIIQKVHDDGRGGFERKNGRTHEERPVGGI